MGKRGPVPKGEYKEKSAVLSTRITEELREQLERATKQSGMTLSREVEHRLRRSFLEDDKAVDMFGSIRNRRLMQLMALAIQNVVNPENPTADWWDDHWCFHQVTTVLESILNSLRPPGDQQSTAAMPERRFELIGLHGEHLQTIGAALVQQVREADTKLSFSSSRTENLKKLIKADLGQAIGDTNVMVTTADLRGAADFLDAYEQENWQEAKRICDEMLKSDLPQRRRDWWNLAALQATRLAPKRRQNLEEKIARKRFTRVDRRGNEK